VAELEASAYSDDVTRRPTRLLALPKAEGCSDTELPDDHSELEAAYASHRAELLGFARRSLGDSELAEDAVQETFARAWRSRQRFNPSLGAMRTWLFAIERHIVVDFARLRRARPTYELDHELASPTDPIEAALLSALVEEALRTLAPPHRQAIVEIYFRGRSSRELAGELGLPEGTVRSRLFYALRALRQGLADRGWES
jgi:RNA polymerase sigma-70 factor (ECF subfamily)